MKKTLLAASAALLAGLATAAPVRLGEIRFVDNARLSAAAARFGEMCGNPMVSMMAVGAISNNDLVKRFGPTRKDSVVTFALDCDDRKLASGDTDAICASLKPLLYYPAAIPEAKFARQHPDAVKTNGCYLLDNSYVAFSKDGRWVVSADGAKTVKKALADLAAAEKPMKRGILAVSFSKPCMKLFRSATDWAIADAKRKGASTDGGRHAIDIFNGIESMGFVVDVDARGISIGGSLKTVAGTEMDKVGRSTLAKNPLAFAPDGALFASALAENCGGGKVAPAIKFARVAACLAKHGFDLTRFAAFDSKGGALNVTFDVKAAAEYCKGAGAKAFDGIDADEIVKVLSEGETDGFTAAGPAQSSSFSLKLAKAQSSPQAIFDATMSDLAAKPIFMANAGTLYGTFMGMLPVIRAELGEEEMAQYEPLLAMLPPPGKGGIATAGWRHGDALKGIVRLSPDEVKGFGALVNLALAANAAGECDACDEDDDDDDDDDDE